eukprot:14370602-Alexandrium_andersonii.AAC.1
MQPDGDVWSQVAKLVEQRGSHAVAVSKVKGHSTDADIARCITDAVLKAGNDRVDQLAAEGRRRGQQHLVFERWIQVQEARYKQFALK